MKAMKPGLLSQNCTGDDIIKEEKSGCKAERSLFSTLNVEAKRWRESNFPR